jgi:hypothetical protein
MSHTELVELQETSTVYNGINGITGLLIYKDQNFLQLLEGQKEDVRILFENKIMKDSRHTFLQPIYEGNIASREFEEWEMKFFNLELQKIENIGEIFAPKKDQSILYSHARGIIEKVLQTSSTQ